jgi:hypothetical protein
MADSKSREFVIYLCIYLLAYSFTSQWFIERITLFTEVHILETIFNTSWNQIFKKSKNRGKIRVRKGERTVYQIGPMWGN